MAEVDATKTELAQAQEAAEHAKNELAAKEKEAEASAQAERTANADKK